LTGASRLLVPLGLFALAFVVRALPHATVLLSGGVHLRGPDGYYHLRRIAYSIHNFPAALNFDPYVAYPTGAKPIWPPLFDWLLALLLWPVSKTGGLAAVERAAVWVPPLLGAATVVAAWALARRYFGERTGLTAGALLSVLGGHFVFSQLGALDHHVAVSLISTGLLAAVMALLAADPAAPRRRDAVRVGLLCALSLLVWPGCLLYVGLALAGVALHALSRTDATQAAAGMRRLALVCACAGALVAPFSLGNAWPQWGAMSPVVLSNFQPWLFATGLAFSLGCAALFGNPRFGSSRAARVGGAALAGATLLIASALLLPELLAGGEDAWRWLAKRERFQASVIESQPLFMVRNQIATHMATRQLSGLLYVYPLLWLAGLLAANRSPRPAPLHFFLAWSLALFATTLLQKRFLDVFSVAFAIQAAWSLELAWCGLRDRVRERGPRRVAAALAGLALLACLAPLWANFGPHLENLARRARAEPIDLTPFRARERILRDTALWLRLHTPRTRAWLDASRRPRYGVMAPWSLGHMLQYVARRPTVTDNFGDDVGAKNFALEQRFWGSPEPEASRMLERLRVRYVLAARRDAIDPTLAPDAIYRSLFARDGSELRPPDEADARAPAAGRYRLLFESDRLPPGEPVPPLYKVFEFVRGARIEGQSAPGTRLRLELPLRTNRNRKILYRASTRADSDGRFAFRVPYANRGGPDSIEVAALYELTCGPERAGVAVDETQVRRGARVGGPDLCSSRNATSPDEDPYGAP
jgi:dolichyl-diphosphooligosaccharide--protein glycosyltransferase